MPRKRSNGEGSIVYEQSRNAYRVYLVAPDGRRITKRFKAEADAIVWKVEQINAMNKGTFVAPSAITVGEWAVEWLKTYKRPTVKQTTYEQYVYLARYLEGIADIKMQELHPMQVQKLYQSLPHLSSNTINKIHKLLKDMWTKAFRLEMMQKNIMEIVESPKFEKKEIEIFAQKDIEKILKACHEHPKLKLRYPAILLAATTGMRKGEIIGLRWCDVNLSDCEIHIRRTLQQTRVGIYLDTPKTKASIRKIRITDATTAALRELKVNTSNIDIKQEKLCFVTRNDTPISPRNFERLWHDLLCCANVPYKNMHVLRHTHATELLAAGVPIVEVSRRLGHNKIGHTLELYGHAIPNYDKKITDKIQRLYAVPK